MKLKWIAIGPNTLGADGYPVQIHRTHDNPPFKLVGYGHEGPYWTLQSAKLDAERIVREHAEFDAYAGDEDPGQSEVR